MSAERLHEDLELFRLIAGGDEAAFREIFLHYGSRIHPFILKIVKDEASVKELVQEVFLKVWVNRESLSKIENPASWLYRIASNLSISHFRKQELDRRVLKEVQQRAVGDAALNTNNGDAVTDEFSAKELKGLIKEAVDLLPEKRRQIYLLLREDGLSRREVAERLNLSENTVRNQLAISLQFIQEHIKKNSGYFIPVLLFKIFFS